MVDLSLFIVSSNLVPNGKPNEFYQITDDKIRVHVNSEVVIGGRVIKVLKIMACTEDWINRYYFNPVDSYSNPQIKSGNNYNTYRTTNNSNNRVNNPCIRCCKIRFILDVILAIFIVIIWLIHF